MLTSGLGDGWGSTFTAAVHEAQFVATPSVIIIMRAALLHARHGVLRNPRAAQAETGIQSRNVPFFFRL